jgi:hypothetical protein
MSPGILGLKGQGSVGRFLGARDVAGRIVAPAIEHATNESIRQNSHSVHIVLVESKRALGQRHDVVQIHLAVGKTRFGVGLHREVCRVRVARPLTDRAQGFSFHELYPEGI